MTDATRDDLDEDDRLPWLEAVEEEESGPSPVKLIAAVVIGLIVIGVVVGGLFWAANRSTGGGEEMIASPGAYKVPAPEAGGLQLDNSASTQIATSEGTQQNAQLATRPETPAPAQQQPAQPAPPAQQPAPVPAPAPASAPRPQRLSGPTIQVGAFPSQAAADGEWRRLAARYPYLGALQHQVMVHQRGGQTFYRLRAAGGEASAVCRRLRAAGQPCMDVND
jgi:type IV secretory pathway VirB10-like protein